MARRTNSNVSSSESDIVIRTFIDGGKLRFRAQLLGYHRLFIGPPPVDSIDMYRRDAPQFYDQTHMH